MPLPDPWLHIAPQGHDNRVWWSVRRSDSRGRRTRPGQLKLDWIDADFLIPADLPEWLHDTVASLGDEEGTHATGPVTLPVFVHPWDTSLPALDVHPEDSLARVEEVLTNRFSIDPERLVIAVAPPRPVRRRQPVELPFDVLACSGRGEEALAQIADAPWYRGPVPDYGITLDTFDLGAGLPPSGCDLLVCDEDQFDWLCAQPTSFARLSARLYVVLTDEHDAHTWIAGIGKRTLSPGASVVWVQSTHAFDRDFLRGLVEGIIHDYPVHQAFKAALRPADGPGFSQPALLLSDPVANQHLRLRDSALRMYERFLTLRERFDFGSVEALLLSSPGALTPAMAQAVTSAAQVSSQVLSNISSYAIEVADFRQESAGLEPRAEVARNMHAARAIRARADAVVTETVSGSLRERMTEVQERRLNLRLLRMTPYTGGGSGEGDAQQPGSESAGHLLPAADHRRKREVPIR